MYYILQEKVKEIIKVNNKNEEIIKFTNFFLYNLQLGTSFFFKKEEKLYEKTLRNILDEIISLQSHNDIKLMIKSINKKTIGYKDLNTLSFLEGETYKRKIISNIGVYINKVIFNLLYGGEYEKYKEDIINFNKDIIKKILTNDYREILESSIYMTNKYGLKAIFIPISYEIEDTLDILYGLTNNLDIFSRASRLDNNKKVGLNGEIIISFNHFKDAEGRYYFNQKIDMNRDNFDTFSHEWFHAFDNIIGKQLDNNENSFLSDLLGHEILHNKFQEKENELLLQYNNFFIKTKKNILSKEDRLLNMNYYKKNIFNDWIDYINSLNIEDEKKEKLFIWLEEFKNNIDNISISDNNFKEKHNNILLDNKDSYFADDNIKNILYFMNKRYVNTISFINHQNNNNNYYFNISKYIDNIDGKYYYSKNNEFFARMFESFISNNIKKIKMKNNIAKYEYLLAYPTGKEKEIFIDEFEKIMVIINKTIDYYLNLN